MKFHQIKTLIHENLTTAFDELDHWDWGSHEGRYLKLKKEFIDKPQGHSIPELQERLIQLVSLLRFPDRHTQEPRYLTLRPFIPELFLGRDTDLTAIYHKLFHEENLLLLVNGQGGIGKTTLAAKYWERYKTHYSHVAWIFAGEDLALALLVLAPNSSSVSPKPCPTPSASPS